MEGLLGVKSSLSLVSDGPKRSIQVSITSHISHAMVTPSRLSKTKLPSGTWTCEVKFCMSTDSKYFSFVFFSGQGVK